MRTLPWGKPRRGPILPPPLLLLVAEVVVDELVVESVLETVGVLEVVLTGGGLVVVVEEAAVPEPGPPRARDDRADATAADAAWARPPARLPLIAPIIGAGGGAGINVAGSMLEKSSKITFSSSWD